MGNETSSHVPLLYKALAWYKGMILKKTCTLAERVIRDTETIDEAWHKFGLNHVK